MQANDHVAARNRRATPSQIVRSVVAQRAIRANRHCFKGSLIGNCRGEAVGPCINRVAS